MPVGTLSSVLEHVSSLSAAPERNADELLALVRSAEPEVRLRALEALVSVTSPLVEAAAVAALSDPDELVRIAAIELIEGQAISSQARSVWHLARTDEDELVRQCALVALSRLEEGPTDAEVVANLAASGPARIAACFLLVRRGRREWLLPLLEGLFDPTHSTRILTLNLADGLLAPQEIGFVSSLLRVIERTDDSVAVRLRIAEFLAT